MKEKSPWLTPFLFFSLLALVVLLFLALFEKKEITVNTGRQGEARTNPFHAAVRFLETRGVRTKSLRRLGNGQSLPDTDEFLFLAATRHAFSRERNEELKDWVSRGGQLIIVAQDRDDDERQDSLLTDFGFGVNFDGTEYLDEPHELTWNESVTIKTTFRSARRVLFPSEETIMYLKDDFGFWYVSTAFDQGTVGVLSESDLFDNDHIGRHDNAFVFWEIITQTGEAPGSVWLVYGEEYESFWTLFFNKGWPALLALALLTGFTLWRMGSRQGPIEPDPPLDRRRLLEHIEASGAFLWRRGFGLHMVEVLRGIMWSRLRHRHPGWQKLEDREVHERIAEISGLTGLRIQQAVKREDLEKEDVFLQTVIDIETIRRAL
ncbi:DUF4350 domain-containing protein [Sulfidibacter corallicola]|uniref:DUF4350 domain-containing protein n=1 Tax=Sulfidibacter corallicola TaxID=2818388 RepID=A0A8A4TPV2_SULCO|nr:DUF4350 domain-containing protein [Sulfidibacter corallicola]QTD51008.1 DUF4350 domain-containing protein [Sulfidibacter corallicola]